VARLDLELAQRAVLLNLARADRDDERLERLLLRGVRDVETARGLLLLLEALHQNAVVQWLDLHRSGSLSIRSTLRTAVKRRRTSPSCPCSPCRPTTCSRACPTSTRTFSRTWARSTTRSSSRSSRASTTRRGPSTSRRP